MRRSLVAVPLLLVLTVTVGCGDDDKDSDSSPEPTTSASAAPGGEGSDAPSEEPSEEPTAQTTQPVTGEQFCTDTQEALHGSSSDQILQQVAQVVADGLPEDMPKDAVDGIQVLIDIAPQLDKASTAIQAYTDLSSTQRSNVNSLAAYLTTTCGKNLIADIVPALKELPSELRSLLPKELTKH
ncbi:hypothetical protein ncot_03250 [Nocardioides sp. JQ2195]|uniref:hypothetical protein n=1 Tax=Nocardioides sp. JQ2195 TaxID=2592334 RepID=UPI00143E2588|nr:hypothetical protein [Nocardioides sp. JQ2195]QIX25715.1 hypothetical protein ncot_03250 [Nocardioides sp. JQ2195]